MLKEFVDRIIDLKQPALETVDGRPYSTRKLEPVHKPTPAPLKVSTLTSLIEYLKSNKDELALSKMMVHVESPDCVSVVSSLEHVWCLRSKFLVVSRETHGQRFEFGKFMASEEFLIQMQSRMKDAGDRALVLRLAGNLRTEKLQTNEDDGVTQVASTRAGVHLATEQKVPNPVKLRPFRTFLEVEQPESPFVFRLKQSREGDLPSAALFEADGGAWALEAIQNIRKYLEEQLKETEIKVIA